MNINMAKFLIGNHSDSLKSALSGFLLRILFYADLIVIFFFSLTDKFDNDEFESIHVAWKMFSGQRIYVDFFEHHHPFFYYMLMGLMGVFKENIMVLFAARGLVFIMFLLILAIGYNISKDLYGKEAALISLILLSTTNTFIYKAVEIRPDVPQILFGLLSIFLLFRGLQRNSVKYLIISSISLGVSFLFLQKAILLLFIIVGILLLSDDPKQIKFRNLFLFVGGFITILIPYYTYLIVNGQFQLYLTDNWAVNTGIFLHAIPDRARELSSIISSFKETPLLWIFWIISLVLLDNPNRERIAGIAVIFIIIHICGGLHYTQYLMMAMSLIAIMSGYAIYNVSCLFQSKNASQPPNLFESKDSLPKKMWHTFLYCKKEFIIWAIIIPCIIFPLGKYLNTIKSSPNMRQLKKIEYVLSITKPTDFVFDGKTNFNIFRNDFEYPWFHKFLRNDVPRQTNLYFLINEFKPKVISNNKYINMQDESILNKYRISDKYSDLLVRVY